MRSAARPLPHLPSAALQAAHYDRGPWRVQVNASNLTDKEYVSACNSSTWCYYGYSRTVTASVRYPW